MRITSLAVALSLLLTTMGLAATANKSKAPVKKAAPVKKSVARKVVRRPATTWRNRQLSPTADRYREIQQALIEKGYLKSEPTGVWDAATVNAMQRFQTDQKLPSTGRINAPSLIGLGLGAKSAGAAEAPALPGAPAAQPATP
jgi:peptidoglycan hydrolase-like protein with peptidoglycan-binding domain